MTRIVKPIFIFLLSCLAGLLLLEGYFQITEFQLPYFELSATVGKKMLPSKRITHFSEGFYLGGTNQYGYLGTGYPIQKTPGKVRVALIGDSYVEGLHVSDKEHFSRIAETLLNKDLPAPKYEVLNFGVGNYNYNDMIISYMNYIRQFKPDILVFLLEKGDFEFRPNFMPSPALKLENDSVVIDYSFTKSPVYKTYRKFSWAFENLAVISAANNALKIAKRPEEINAILFDKFYTGFDKGASKKPNDTEEFHDVALDQRVLKSFAWLKGTPCLFIFRTDVARDVENEIWAAGIDTASVTQALKKELTDKHIDYKYWDVTGLRGHWNHAAQKVVGKELSRLILIEEKKRR